MLRHYTDWLTGVKDGRYDRPRLTMRQWREITRHYRDYGAPGMTGEQRVKLSRRAYLRGYKRGQRARQAYAEQRVLAKRTLTDPYADSATRKPFVIIKTPTGVRCAVPVSMDTWTLTTHTARSPSV